MLYQYVRGIEQHESSWCGHLLSAIMKRRKIFRVNVFMAISAHGVGRCCCRLVGEPHFLLLPVGREKALVSPSPLRRSTHLIPFRREALVSPSPLGPSRCPSFWKRKAGELACMSNGVLQCWAFELHIVLFQGQFPTHCVMRMGRQHGEKEKWEEERVRKAAKR